MKVLGISENRKRDARRSIYLQMFLLVVWITADNIGQLVTAGPSAARTTACMHAVALICTGLPITVLLSMCITTIIARTRKLWLRFLCISTGFTLMLYLWMVLSRLSCNAIHSRLYQAPFHIDKVYACTDGMVQVKLLGFLTLIYFIIRFYRNLKIQYRISKRNKKEAINSKLEALQNEVSPHFLLNALNMVTTDIPEHHPTQDTIEKLSCFLQYSLSQTRNELFVPLRKEIEACNYYMGVQAKRPGKNIEFETHIAENTLDYPIPPFILNPLLENAVKYGKQTPQQPLTIMVGAMTDEKNRLHLIVANRGKLVRRKKHGTGIGLSNLRKRLELIMPGAHDIKLFQRHSFVFVTIIGICHFKRL
ncbi:MAG: hypothetical protein GY765_15070, partial [bacterium]|nr:hypothetical protein [bacterium]